MSQWTHVAGTIRCGTLFKNKTVIEKTLGPTVGFGPENLEENWEAVENSDTPCGSEGSLQHQFVKTGNESSLNFGSVIIWGDLRDYEDVEVIEKWFSRVVYDLQENGVMIRDAVLKIDVEYKDSVILSTVLNDKTSRAEVRSVTFPARIS